MKKEPKNLYIKLYKKDKDFRNYVEDRFLDENEAEWSNGADFIKYDGVLYEDFDEFLFSFFNVEEILEEYYNDYKTGKNDLYYYFSKSDDEYSLIEEWKETEKND